MALAPVAAAAPEPTVALAGASLAAVAVLTLAPCSVAERRIARVRVVGRLAALAHHPARESLLAVAPALASLVGRPVFGSSSAALLSSLTVSSAAGLLASLLAVAALLADVTARLTAFDSRASGGAGVVFTARAVSVAVTAFVVAEVVALLAPTADVLVFVVALTPATVSDSVVGLLGQLLVVVTGLVALTTVMVMVVVMVLVGLARVSASPGAVASVVAVGPTLVSSVAALVHPVDVGLLAASLVVVRICHLNSPVREIGECNLQGIG